MKMLLLINPVAGRQIMEQEEEKVQQVFTAAGYTVICLHTQLDVSINTQIEEANTEKDIELVVCAGGDGTLNQTTNAMFQLGLEDIPMGYLPAGTTNDFATSLKLSKKPVEAAEDILNGTLRRLDAGKYGENRYFVYVASFGAFTQISYSTTQSLKNTLGHLAYVVEGMKELPNLKEYHVRVETEEEVFEDEYVFGAISNTNSIGGIIRLSEEDVKLDDGVMELILVKKPKNIIDLSHILISLMSGNYDPAVITFRHVRTARFSSSESIPWSLDGEYASGGTDITIETIPLKFVCRYDHKE